MYNIVILSKEECINLTRKNILQKSIVISINDTNYNTVLNPNDNIVDILKVWFDDIQCSIPGHKMITNEDTSAIKHFVDINVDSVQAILIHCTAGISRSSAVGIALAKYLNGDDTELVNSNKYLPNIAVYKMMCKTLNIAETDLLLNSKDNEITDQLLDLANSEHGLNLKDLLK